MEGMRGLIEEAHALLCEITQGAVPSSLSKGTYGVKRTGGDTEFFYPDPSFPFHTRAAQEVFALAKSLMIEYPELKNKELADLAVRAAGYTREDLTPEDHILLHMAIDWVQNGPPQGVGGKGSRTQTAGALWRIGVSESRGGTSYPSTGRVAFSRGSARHFEEPPSPEEQLDPNDERTRSSECHDVIARIRTALLRLNKPRSKKDRRPAR